MVLSLTACGGSKASKPQKDEPKATVATEPTLELYTNPGILGDGNNISFVFAENEDQTEVYILNISAPDITKGLTVTDDCRLHNDLLNLRIFGRNEWDNLTSYFTFNGYGEIQLTVSATDKIFAEGQEHTTISEDGAFLFIKDGEDYEIWAKDSEVAVLIQVDGLDGVKLATEEDYKILYESVKEHFTFAKASTKEFIKNELLFTVPNLESATNFGETTPNGDIKNWCFAHDLLHSQLETAGIKLMTSQNLSGSNSFVISKYINTIDVKKSFRIYFDVPYENTPTFKSCDQKTEFSIGSTKFRLDSRDKYWGDGIGFISQSATGTEYSFGITHVEPNTPIDVKTAKEYLMKLAVEK